MAPHRIGWRNRLLSPPPPPNARDKKGARIAYYRRNPTGHTARWEPTFFFHQQPRTQPLTCDALMASRHRATSPLFCKTTIINQNPISQQRHLLLEWQRFRGHLRLAFQLFYSLPFPLSLILLSCCHRRCRRRRLLLSARNTHSRKYILCKLSSRCCSWFHKWWWNGQESAGVNGKRWLLRARTIFHHSPFS